MPRPPEEYPRRLLVAVTGLSPQVVTETLYALAVAARPRFVPTEIHLLTTAEGAERARLYLLSHDPGWFRRFCEEYQVDGIRFGGDHLHLLTDEEGHGLNDIRSEADNALLANQIAGWVRRFTADPDAALHVSLAGGRKTMGFYIAYSLSLWGRPQDRLSHVLVSAPFESHPGFFYPRRESHIIYTPPPDSRPLDASSAEVSLAEIPFVRLREWLPASVLDRETSFIDAVEAAQHTLGPPELRFQLRKRTVMTSRSEIRLPPAELAFYSWIARRHLAGRPVSAPPDGAPSPEYASGFLADYQNIVGLMGADDRTRHALRHGMEKSFFMEHKSRLNRQLRGILGRQAEPYLVRPYGRRPNTTYGLEVPADCIRWKE